MGNRMYAAFLDTKFSRNISEISLSYTLPIVLLLSFFCIFKRCMAVFHYL